MRYIGADVRLSTPQLDRLRKRLEPELSKAVRAIAFAIEAEAKVRAAVDTGAMRASIYVETVNKSGQQKAHGDAERKYPGPGKRTKKRRGPVPWIKSSPPAFHKLEAIVVVGVEYGKHVEFGTHRMPARPFLIPAARSLKQAFRDQVARAIRRARRSVQKSD